MLNEKGPGLSRRPCACVSPLVTETNLAFRRAAPRRGPSKVKLGRHGGSVNLTDMPQNGLYLLLEGEASGIQL